MHFLAPLRNSETTIVYGINGIFEGLALGNCPDAKSLLRLCSCVFLAFDHVIGTEQFNLTNIIINSARSLFKKVKQITSAGHTIGGPSGQEDECIHPAPLFEKSSTSFSFSSREIKSYYVIGLVGSREIINVKHTSDFDKFS